MSWLYRRALAALEGLYLGEGQPQAGGMLDWSLKLGRWLLDRRPGPHPAHRIAEPGDRHPLPEPPVGLPREFWAAGAGVVVGLLRRPQDHNGIVDDAVTLVAPLCDTSVDIASACALAGFLSSLVDGWDAEGAMSQSLFVAKRGETFGKEKGPSLLLAFDEIFDRIDEVQNREDAANSVLAASSHQIEGRPIPPIALALGLAYIVREPEEVTRLVALVGTDRRGADNLAASGDGSARLSAIITMLTAAAWPSSLPGGAVGAIEERTDVAELLDELLELREARYRRAPLYSARFRRKKC